MDIKKITHFTLAIILLSSCNGGGREHTQKKPLISPKKAITIAPVVKPTVNVYIENSGSMDGYVKGVTEFEQAVYGYLSDIKISEVTDTLNLFYINSKVIPQGSDISDFIEKLEPNSFKEKGGNRGISDLSNVFKSVLSETDQNEIAIWVTDGIFSPGKGKNAQEYIVNQQIGIKNTMANYLKKYPNTAVVVYQLNSQFDGIYYNNVDERIPLHTQRPYYIWLIGQTSNIEKLIREVPESKFKGSGVEHSFTIVPGNQNIDYAIKDNSGNFSRSRNNPTTEIKDLSIERGGKVKFAINVDFSKLLLDDEYLNNPSNYELSNYELTVKKYNGSKKYTHTLYFSSDKVRNGLLNIKLKMSEPAWLKEVNDDDGTTAIANKTFGIKNQIEGIYEAYTNKTNHYTEMNINIK